MTLTDKTAAPCGATGPGGAVAGVPGGSHGGSAARMAGAVGAAVKARARTPPPGGVSPCTAPLGSPAPAPAHTPHGTALATVAQSLAALGLAGGGSSPASPPARAARGVALLAGFLDLRGSVTLADVLADPQRAEWPAVDRAYARDVIARARAESAHLDHRLASACADLLASRTSLLSASRVLPALVDGGVLDGGVVVDTSAGAVERAARIVAGPVIDYLDLRIERVRAGLRDVRAEYAADFAALSGAAARLETLDRILASVTELARSRVTAPFLPTVERAFARELRAALDALVPGATIDATVVAAWAGSAPSPAGAGTTTAAPSSTPSNGGAPLRRAAALAADAALALFRHERVGFDALVDAIARTVSL